MGIKAAIVIPTYNERHNIEQLIKTLCQMDNSFQIIIVDDNSPDGTGKIADRLAKRYKQIHVIHQGGKLGLGKAYIKGFKYALTTDAQYIFQMDADFSHDPRYLPNFLKKIRNYDLIIGSRYLNGISVVNWGFKRLLISKMATKYVRMITGLPVTDATSGFKCFRRKVLENIGLDDVCSTGYSFQIETSYKSYKKGFRIGEVPIIFVDRHAGTSKMNWRIVLEALWVVWRLRLGF